MASIHDSVGLGGANQPEDVKIVQALLNQRLHPSPGLDEDGTINPKTTAAIQSFQSEVSHLVRPEGRVDPDGMTLAALNADAPEPEPPPDHSDILPAVNPNRSALTAADYVRAATALHCEVACVKAVTAVEAGASGFFPSGRPKILFEASHFSRLTNHVYDRSHPGISSPRWNRALYKGGEREYDRLLEAAALNRHAALQAASWGRFQIMGFNFKESGFASVDAYVNAMYESEGRQLDAFIGFVKSSEQQLAAPLRERRWAIFAEHYNGPGYAENHYDSNLRAAYERFA
jgi:hypothetical protein